jgi:hypothetical protein
MGAPVWEQHPQIENAVPTPPNGDAVAYLGAAGDMLLELRKNMAT